MTAPDVGPARARQPRRVSPRGATHASGAGRPSRPLHVGDAGFTLIEMLVALSITALVALVLMSSIGMLAPALSRATIADARLDELTAAQGLLRERIVSMRPDRDVQSAGAALDANGSDARLDFNAAPPDRDAPDAPWHYRLTRTGNGDLVLYSINTLDSRVDRRSLDVNGWVPVRVIRNIAALRIGYFGRDPASGEFGWQNNWSHRNALPMLVRVVVAFPDGDSRTWPDLYVHPRAAVPELCTIDLTTGQCGTNGKDAT